VLVERPTVRDSMSFYTNPIVFTALAITSYGFYRSIKIGLATAMDKSVSDREYWLSMLPGYALVAFGIGIMASMYPFKN